MILKILASVAGVSIPVSSSVVSYYAYTKFKPNPNSEPSSLVSSDQEWKFPILDPLVSEVLPKLNSYIKEYTPPKVIKNLKNVLKFVDTPEFQEDYNFASLSSFYEYWPRYYYPSNDENLKESEPNPVDLNKSEYKNLKKSTVRNIFIDLLENFKSNAVGKVFNGAILEFPSKFEDSKLWNLSSSFYLSKDLIPTFVDSQIYIQPFSSFSSDSNNLKKYKDEFMNHKDSTTSIPGLSQDSSVSYISYSSLKQKAVEWFKFWGDSNKEKEGDFYLSDTFSSISLNNSKHSVYDIFKIHNGKQYKFSLIFKVSYNASSNIVHNVLSPRTIDKYKSAFDLNMHSKTKIDRWLYPFLVLSKLANLPEGTEDNNLEFSKLGNISSGRRQIHMHERFSNCHYKVKDYQSYLSQIYIRK